MAVNSHLSALEDYLDVCILKYEGSHASGNESPAEEELPIVDMVNTEEVTERENSDMVYTRYISPVPYVSLIPMGEWHRVQGLLQQHFFYCMGFGVIGVIKGINMWWNEKKNWITGSCKMSILNV